MKKQTLILFLLIFNFSFFSLAWATGEQASPDDPCAAIDSGDREAESPEVAAPASDISTTSGAQADDQGEESSE